MHVLVTADSLSGSWTYTRELVTGLVTRGVRVTLVSFGEIPLPDQTSWMDHLHGLDYRPTAFRLEWMQEAEEDLPESSAFLAALVRELRPDVLHLNQFCYGNLPVDVPARGNGSRRLDHLDACCPQSRAAPGGIADLVSQHGSQRPGRRGCSRRALRMDARSHFGLLCAAAAGEVIYPGRNPIFFNPYVNKDDCVLAVGRLVDAGKQVFLLTQQPHPVPVCIVGAEHTVPMPRIPIRADVKVDTEQTSVAIRGPQTEAQLRALYSRASIYAATARYEPLGMAALEAAFSRCAIVANDIPSFREIWGDAALYFRTNDAASLAENIRMLNADRPMRRAYAELAYSRARERFTTKRMIDDCLQLYRSLVSRAVAAYSRKRLFQCDRC